jgi:hypothetical protein
MKKKMSMFTASALLIAECFAAYLLSEAAYLIDAKVHRMLHGPGVEYQPSFVVSYARFALVLLCFRNFDHAIRKDPQPLFFRT